MTGNQRGVPGTVLVFAIIARHQHRDRLHPRRPLKQPCLFLKRHHSLDIFVRQRALVGDHPLGQHIALGQQATDIAQTDRIPAQVREPRRSAQVRLLLPPVVTASVYRGWRPSTWRRCYQMRPSAWPSHDVRV
jgi:hypothetical protein